MTIDEAIAHAEWAANNCEGECSEEHRQLAEWLRELKQWQKLVEGINLRPASLMKPLQPNLEHENDRLRELVEVLINCGRKYHTMNGACPMFDADAEGDDFCGAVQAARELGIEVE